METVLNVLGSKMQECSCKPMTGWYRDGKCHTDDQDHGVHTVCAEVDDEFLEFLKMRGNDLITPNPMGDFPGLKAGDSWCVCAGSWLDAYRNGKACKVNLSSTNEETLAVIPLTALQEFSSVKQ